MVKANLNFFDKLFNVDDGYIHINNILSLRKNKFTEVFDQNKLTFVLNNLDQVKDKYRDGARNLPILESYLSHSKNGKIQVIYDQDLEKAMYGRYMAKNCLSGQNMVREVRHTIFDEYYLLCFSNVLAILIPIN